MSHSEMSALVNRGGIYSVGDLSFRVRTTDVRPATFGRTDVFIVPVSGHGGRWVSVDSVALDSKAAA